MMNRGMAFMEVQCVHLAHAGVGCVMECVCAGGLRVQVPHKPQMKAEDLVITESVWLKENICTLNVKSYKSF